MAPATSEQKVYLVIGGCGFLGRYIVEQLLDRGEKHVRIFDIRKTFDDPRIEKFIIGDLRKFDDVKAACEGVTTVFNTASPTHGFNYDFYYAVNVTGTLNLINACQECGVKQLVYTSSASVVFNGRDLHNVDETTPYCKKQIDPYNTTKELGERAVLAANGKKGVLTCAIRPSAIFGPRDVQMWPSIIQVARQGKSKYQLGNGKNLNDFTYVENAANAHILAADKMTEGSPICGQAYFVTNGEPMPMWDMIKYIYRNLGYPEPSIVIPYWFAWYMSMIIDLVVLILSPIVTLHPNFTFFRVVNSCASRSFNISKAKRDLGYKPAISMKVGMERTLEYFKKWHEEQIKKEQESKQKKQQ